MSVPARERFLFPLKNNYKQLWRLPKICEPQKGPCLAEN